MTDKAEHQKNLCCVKNLVKKICHEKVQQRVLQLKSDLTKLKVSVSIHRNSREVAETRSDNKITDFDEIESLLKQQISSRHD